MNLNWCILRLYYKRERALRVQIPCEFDRFFITHFIVPFLLFVLIFSVLEVTNLDIWIEQHFYDPNNKKWPLRHHWLTQIVLHDWGQKLSIGMGVLVFFAFLFSWLRKSLHPFSRHLGFLFIASISGPTIIAIVKHNSHIHCPWDLLMFGGNKPYIRLLDSPPYPLEGGHCFPAGHAGGGYAFISLYFFLLLIKPEYRYFGLVFGLAIGLVFGITQQMRGAHFLSHDIFSLATCWFSSLLLFNVFFWKQLQWQQSQLIRVK